MNSKVAILIPCLNEEKAIARVIRAIPNEILLQMNYEAEVLVIDNNSNDNTARIAHECGASVIIEKRRGKGYALKRGFASLPKDTEYVIVIDGDDTYKPSEIPRLLEPLRSNFCDVISGSRLSGKQIRDSLSFSHRVVNWGLSFIVRQFYQANITDVLTGFFALKRNVVDDILPYLRSNDFTIEMELTSKLSKLGYTIFSMPITYDRRIGKSKIHEYKDGSKIVMMLLAGIMWRPPRITKLKMQYEDSGSI
jgi:glycosyltransferase involved in cell wall biosynthesis